MENKNSRKPRKIDESIEKTSKFLGSQFALVSRIEIKAWKAFLVLFFVAGLATAIVFSVQMNIQTKSSAKSASNLDNFLANPPKDPDGKEQHFEKYTADSKVVYFSQRKIDNAIVEKDQSVYVFDKANGNLKEKKTSYRSGLPQHLPADLITKEKAEDSVSGKSKFSTLYYASPDSDIFKINFDRTKPIWAVTSFDSKGIASLTIIDAVTGKKLGNGVPPPSAAYLMTGPIALTSPCELTWAEWSDNAASWFSRMGYATNAQVWPPKTQEMSEIQKPEAVLFFELAHGTSTYYWNACQQITKASEIHDWLNSYPAKQFAFIGSCDGLCSSDTPGTLSYEFRKGSYINTTAVGYCGMGSSACGDCWLASISWQDDLFNYMSRGYKVKNAFDQANIDYPTCGINNCMRFSGDPNYSLNNDTQPPTVSITSPADGSTVFGTTPVTASATDNVGVTEVDFYLDNVLQFSDTGPPYSFDWNTTAVGSGAHTLSAKAYDAAGNVGTSANVGVNVSNNDTQPPVVSITSPVGGATVSGTTSVAASATDNVGVTRVDFYLDNVLQFSSAGSPSFRWNTTAVANGAHTLSAKAYDAAGNVGTSANVGVNVSNAPDKTNPTVSLTSPANNSTVTMYLKISATARDNVKVVSMRALIDNNQVCSSALSDSPVSADQSSNTSGLLTLSCSVNILNKYTKGTHAVTVEAADAAGNKGKTTANVIFK